VKRLNDAGYLVLVVTNQAGVSKGFCPKAQIGVRHDWMAKEFAAAGAHVDAWEYCPNHPEALMEQYRLDCARREPKPSMLTDLLACWPVERAHSFLIGDRDTDLAVAQAAGRPGYLLPGRDLDAFLRRLLPACHKRRCSSWRFADRHASALLSTEFEVVIGSGCQGGVAVPDVEPSQAIIRANGII